jgi:hypothetical protein
MGVSDKARTPVLTFGGCRYFDAVDTSEILGYEAAAARHQRLSWVQQNAYRSWLGSPFELARRAAGTGAITLTIIKGSEVEFLIHKRRNVGLGDGNYHVVPAGEFQPVAVTSTAFWESFDLWDNICREYAEELLGEEDAIRRRNYRIDKSKPPYSLLESARRSGALTVWYLGVAADPLTWKPDILTVAVFDQAAFDEIFPWDLVEQAHSDEGEGEGEPMKERFEPYVLEQYIRREDTLATGRALLDLASKYRARLI